MAKFGNSFCQTLKQTVFLVLIVSSIFVCIAEMYQIGSFTKGIGEGLSIIISALFLIFVTSYADLAKDKQFVSLQSEILEENITVLRGKLGSTTTQSIWSLVVGDVILLDGGCKVPADCIIIESQDLEVDEDNNRNDDVQNIKRKGPYERPERGQRYVEESDPFLFYDSLIMKGTCKALVVCVGESSSRNAEVNKMEVDQDTELAVKLENLGD